MSPRLRPATEDDLAPGAKLRVQADGALLTFTLRERAKHPGRNVAADTLEETGTTEDGWYVDPPQLMGINRVSHQALLRGIAAGRVFRVEG